eukprot:jgi/Botrbrau1/13005/Bobra.0389s0004.1
MEELHVHNVYDTIAPHFSATRFAVWPKVRAYIDSLPQGALVADVGCGNGKYFAVRPDLAILASDRSSRLAEVAAQRLDPAHLQSGGGTIRADVMVADALDLPYKDGAFDGVLCIAVLHHISSRARRIRLLKELVRVLRSGGTALVTVWATEQEEPHKLAKWHPIPPPTLGAAPGEGCGCPSEGSTVPPPGGATLPDRPWDRPVPVGQTPTSSVPGATLPNRSTDAPAGPSLVAAGASAEVLNRQRAVEERWGGSESGGRAAAAVGTGGLNRQTDGGSGPEGGGSGDPVPAAGGSGPSAGGEGGDFLVPWHVPFHRVEAGGLAAGLMHKHPSSKPLTKASSAQKGSAKKGSALGGSALEHPPAAGSHSPAPTCSWSPRRWSPTSLPRRQLVPPLLVPTLPPQKRLVLILSLRTPGRSPLLRALVVRLTCHLMLNLLVLSTRQGSSN